LLEEDPRKYDILKKTRLQIDGLDDMAEWRLLKVSMRCKWCKERADRYPQDALRVVGFSPAEQFELFRIPAVILHIGNLLLIGDRSDQAFLPPASQAAAERVCHLLGIPVSEFIKTVLRPKVRAGREWVTHARTKKQAEDELGALCKFMYEKTFGWIVDRINTALDRPSPKASVAFIDC